MYVRRAALHGWEAEILLLDTVVARRHANANRVEGVAQHHVVAHPFIVMSFVIEVGPGFTVSQKACGVEHEKATVTAEHGRPRVGVREHNNKTSLGVEDGDYGTRTTATPPDNGEVVGEIRSL